MKVIVSRDTKTIFYVSLRLALSVLIEIMKAIAYSILPHEKESLVLANGKKHDLTLISNDLNLKTLIYSYGKQTVIISVNDVLDAALLQALKNIGISNIMTRSSTTAHVDLETATYMGFKIARVSSENQSVDFISQSIISNLDSWEHGACIHEDCCSTKSCVLKLNQRSI